MRLETTSLLEGGGAPAVRRFVALACLALVALHTVFTLAYLTPLNPIKVGVMARVDAYMLPVFGQKWELFAPDPKGKTHYLLVSCRVPRGDGTLEETPWLDTTSRLYAQHYSNRLAVGDRIARAELAVLHFVFPRSSELFEAIKKLPADDPAAKSAREAIEKGADAEYALGIRMLGRVASIECDEAYGRGRSTEVRARITSFETPPFAERTRPIFEGTPTTYDFEWQAYTPVDPY